MRPGRAVLCCGPFQRAAAACSGRVQREAQAVVTGEHEGRATGGRTARKCRLFYLSVLGLGQGAEGGHVVVVESGSLLAYLEQVRVVITEIFIVATSYTTK